MPARRVQVPSRARRALAWALLLFAGLQLVTALAMERLLPGLRDAEYADKLTRLRTLTSQFPDRPTVLLLGSSRTMMAFQAGRVHARWEGRDVLAFNFGVRGGGPLLQLVVLRRLLADGIHPDFLLLEVLPPLFNDQGSRPLEEEWLQGSRLRISEMLRLRRYHTDPGRLVRQWLRRRWAPWATYGPELRGWLADGVPEAPLPPGNIECGPTDPHGYQPYFPDGIDAKRQAYYFDVARLQYGPAFGDFRLADRPALALKDLLDFCQQQRITVALVLMPEGSAFRALYPPAMRQGLEACLSKLSARRGIPVIDARAWVDEDGFWDTHHALPAGAAVFTERLVRQGLQPLLDRLVRPNRRSQIAQQ